MPFTSGRHWPDDARGAAKSRASQIGRTTSAPLAEGTGAFLRIATTQRITTAYTDRDVRSGRTYRYAVTALDRAPKANESPRSNEVSVTLP